MIAFLIRTFQSLFWHPYPKEKPTVEDWYTCTVSLGTDMDGNQQYSTMDLFWEERNHRFLDNRVLNVFDMYAVYGWSVTKEATVRLHTYECAHLWNLTARVVSWRKTRKPFAPK